MTAEIDPEMFKRKAKPQTAKDPADAILDGDGPAGTWGSDEAQAPKKKGTRFTQTFSSKGDPATLAEFEQLVDELGMKKTSAMDQALKLWIAKNK